MTRADQLAALYAPNLPPSPANDSPEDWVEMEMRLKETL